MNIDDAELRKRIGRYDKDVGEMFFHLAVNHAVLIESSSETDHNQACSDSQGPHGMVYSASSADEGALVYGASHFGYRLIGHTGNSLTVLMPLGEKLHVHVLARFEFDSYRKRSSVLVRYRSAGEEQQNQVVLLTKVLIHAWH